MKPGETKKLENGDVIVAVADGESPTSRCLDCYCFRDVKLCKTKGLCCIRDKVHFHKIEQPI